MSDDGYGNFDLSDFTEEDFAHIDAVLQIEDGDNPGPKGGPATTIKVEQPIVNIVSKALSSNVSTKSMQEMSPYRRYRWNKTLSVTDLVSPAWCEVQFDYGLRQKRFKSIDQRPASFVSSKGKEIFVEKKVAVQNDLTTKQGKSVHKKLEQELWPEEVRVDIATDEERWALRLVNMLSGLDCLMALGYTREMPVFGILHDQVVVGIIDEISRKLIPEVTPISPKRAAESSQVALEPKRIRRTSPTPQTQNALVAPNRGDESVSVPTTDKGPSMPPPRPPTLRQHPYTLHLLDTKTRRSSTLPLHEDTLPSRLQLMLYHRLLTSLISTPQPFDFPSLWTRLNLNAVRPFSTRFMLQAGLIRDSSRGAAPSCLDDLCRVWMDAACRLEVVGVDRTLQILYRTRPEDARRERKGKPKGSAVETVNNPEQEAIAKAIEESLKDIDRNAVEDEELARALAESLNDLPAQEAEALRSDLSTPVQSVKEDVTVSKAREHIKPKTSVDTGDGSASKDETPSDGHVSNIIGTVEFAIDDTFLDAYLVDVLQWWHGGRPPRGVEIEQSRRCFTCEYCEGCEWREVKAMEAAKPKQAVVDEVG